MQEINNKVEVLVRCCPLSASKVNQAVLGSIHPVKRCIQPFNDFTLTLNGTNFSFDRVFGEATTQLEIYNECFSSLVGRCFQGHNATIFAYGQTGSGKTYSIIGNPKNDDEKGILPRILKQIFDTIQNQSKYADIKLSISYLEIYNEEVHDLLHPEVLSKDILIRETKEGQIFFTGAKDEEVCDIDEALYYLEKGNICRSTAETNLNMTSSRSHAIFTMNIEISTFSSGGQRSYINSRLHVVDLAGSERASRTGADGIRFKESIGINQGLLSLGKVIRALSTLAMKQTKADNTKTIHIPYRESKLTRFLQDSLGGNSLTTILACISPADINLHETLSTLEYASRARNIQNKVVANISMSKKNKFKNENTVLNMRNYLYKMKDGITKDDINLYLNYLSKENSNDVEKYSFIMNNICEAYFKLKKALESSTLSDQLYFSCKETNQLLHGLIKHICLQGKNSNTKESIDLKQPIVAKEDDNKFQSSEVSSKFKSDIMEDESRLKSSIEISPDEIIKLKLEIEECKEDLRRDEEIFAEKMKELKKAKKTIKKLQHENLCLVNELSLTKERSRISLYEIEDKLRESSTSSHNSMEFKKANDSHNSIVESNLKDNQIQNILDMLSRERERSKQLEWRNGDLNKELRALRLKLKE